MYDASGNTLVVLISFQPQKPVPSTGAGDRGQTDSQSKNSGSKTAGKIIITLWVNAGNNLVLESLFQYDYNPITQIIKYVYHFQFTG